MAEKRKRARGKATRYRGVKSLGGGEYEVRVKRANPKTGRPKTFRRIVEAQTAAEANRLREALAGEWVRGHEVAPVQRLSDFALSWLRSKVPNLARSTRSTYALSLGHVCDEFGDHYVDRITHDDVIDWRNRMLAGGVAPNTLAGWLRVFRSVMRAACRRYQLAVNPTEGVVVKQPPKLDTDAGKVLTAAELHQVLEGVRTITPQWYPVILTAALTGARWGAVAALKWEDVDTDAGAITVRRAHWRQSLGDTKTGIIRTLPLPPPLATVLMAHRGRLEQANARGYEEGWCFPGRYGALPNPSTIRRPLDKVLVAIGMAAPRVGTDGEPLRDEDGHVVWDGRRVSAHWFRYTFNNLVRGVSEKEVRKALTGHVTDAMAEHYSHVPLAEKAIAVGQVVELVDLG